MRKENSNGLSFFEWLDAAGIKWREPSFVLREQGHLALAWERGESPRAHGSQAAHGLPKIAPVLHLASHRRTRELFVLRYEDGQGERRKGDYRFLVSRERADKIIDRARRMGIRVFRIGYEVR